MLWVNFRLCKHLMCILGKKKNVFCNGRDYIIPMILYDVKEYTSY